MRTLATQSTPIPWAVIDRMPPKVADYIIDRRLRGVPTEGFRKPEAVIFDMDGTLCNVDSIRHYVVLGHPDNRGYRDFDHFHKASVWCPPNEAVLKRAVKHAAAGRTVIVVTARRSRYRNYTKAWLDSHAVPYAEMHMRRDDDDRPDAVIKREILTQLRIRYDVVECVDDNPHVLAVWREERIPKVIEVPGWMD